MNRPKIISWRFFFYFRFWRQGCSSESGRTVARWARLPGFGVFPSFYSLLSIGWWAWLTIWTCRRFRFRLWRVVGKARFVIESIREWCRWDWFELSQKTNGSLKSRKRNTAARYSTVRCFRVDSISWCPAGCDIRSNWCWLSSHPTGIPVLPASLYGTGIWRSRCRGGRSR